MLLVPALFLSWAAFSQQPKGLQPSDKNSSPLPGKTRALVVGISEYHHLEKLRFAHRDAEIFAQYLLSANVPAADIVLLRNEEAKRGNVLTELLRLARLSRPGDHLVFYFSGHGDVENATRSRNGYLLTQDTYTNNYMVGALSVNDLRDVFLTLCHDSVRVTVITDACRSGKLAGGATGTEYTATLLKPLWDREIKLLSSEPSQLSQEGTQWGEGRGVFSYYLVKGLEGEADSNHDSLITIAELESFVGAQVAGITRNAQQPVIQGPNKYSTIIASLKKSAGDVPGFRGGNRVRYKWTIPFSTTDSCAIYQEALENAIQKGELVGHAPGTAVEYYQSLSRCAPGSDWQLRANAQLLSALMNAGQEIVNNTFIGKKFVTDEGYDKALALYHAVLDNNDLRLPVETQVVNLRRYLEVMRQVLLGYDIDFNRLDAILDSALALEPGAPHLLTAQGIKDLRKGNYSLAIQSLEEASRTSPGWLIPIYYLGVSYGKKREYKKALAFYDEVYSRDSLARTYDCAKCIEKEMADYRKRVNRINAQANNRDPKSGERLDSMRHQLEDAIDSAFFYHEMARMADRKNHPLRDSVYYYHQQAITLDPWEFYYFQAFIEFLRKEFYGEEEIRGLVAGYMNARGMTEDIYDEEERYINEVMLYSFLYSKKYEDAFRIVQKIYEGGFYSCRDLQKMRKEFKNYNPFLEWLRECE
jgi:tetratricopeptide (TPR) repeat protein